MPRLLHHLLARPRRSNPAFLLGLPLLLVLVSSQVGCSLFGYHGVEEWPSTTVLEDGRYEVRRYEPAAVAMTVVEPGVEDVGNEGFR
ncbi:MAG: hypothetical protein ACIAXF_17010, partial [Phycisphaerales bacterium JB063]